MLFSNPKEGSSLFLVGAAHLLTDVMRNENQNPKAYPAFKHMDADSSIAVTLKSVIDKYASIRIDVYFVLGYDFIR
jgi:hypothetical protein